MPAAVWPRFIDGDGEGCHSSERMRDLTRSLAQAGRRAELLEVWRSSPDLARRELSWLADMASQALRCHDLEIAGTFAALLADLRWKPPSPVLADAALSVSKVDHDAQQFRYLQDIGVLGSNFDQVVDDYSRLAAALRADGIKGRIPLDDICRRRIGHVYGRMVHKRHTPRVRQALSNCWSRDEVEARYLGTPPGLVVIDNFLTRQALDELHAFCLQSTVWTGNRYAYGRVGAFFHDGFNCPLLLQIAEEIRGAFPRVIGIKYPLRQLWAFKNDSHLPADANTHADFAAVNVNFWITPTEANADKNTGGLVVYGTDAPPDWDFDMYNSSPDLIRLHLASVGAQRITIPYKANRAIVFNSDLFHGTDALDFHPGYANRRVNVTLLYGERGDDAHHAYTNASAQRFWRSRCLRVTRP